MFISSGVGIDSLQLFMEVQNAIQKIENRDRTNHGEIMTKVSKIFIILDVSAWWEADHSKFHSMLERVEHDVCLRHLHTAWPLTICNLLALRPSPRASACNSSVHHI